jgi:hypothetical protein
VSINITAPVDLDQCEVSVGNSFDASFENVSDIVLNTNPALV